MMAKKKNTQEEINTSEMQTNAQTTKHHSIGDNDSDNGYKDP